jgi:Heparinase II/III-like protein
VRRMFRAPLALAFPDLTLPAIHDCWYFIGLLDEVGHGIPSAAGFYEIAYGWYGDPEFAWVLRENYARRSRASFEALLDGAETIPAADTPVFGCSHLADSGLVVLRTAVPGEQQSYLLLRAGPGGGGHGHPDQLNIQLFARGARLTTDLGTPGYGINLNDTWYRQTASHSTALVDGRSQPAATGQMTRFEVDGQHTAVGGAVAWDEGDYSGVRMRRLILWRESYFVDVFQVECPRRRQIDWIYHTPGELAVTTLF